MRSGRDAADDPIASLVRNSTEGLIEVEDRVAWFHRVRGLAYATDGASTAIDLIHDGRGNCLAKSELLISGFRFLGYQARRMRWTYQLPAVVPEVLSLPSRNDVHTAVEVRIESQWVLVDATHDPPLARGGLSVAEWDGVTATARAYEPTGPVWREGEDDAAIGAAVEAVADGQLLQVEGMADRFAQYQVAFNRFLDELRSSQLAP